MRVDANETHRVHTEKKAFSFDFIKTRWIRKTNNSHQFRVETKYPRPGDRMYGGGGEEESNKAASRFWLIFRYFNRNIAFISFSNIRNYLAIQYEISNANIDFVIRIIISRRCIRFPGICNLSTFQSKVVAKNSHFIFIMNRNVQICIPPPPRDAKWKKNRFFGNITFNPGARLAVENFVFTPLILRPRRVITLHLRRNRCHLAVDLLNNVIYGTVRSLSLSLSISRRSFTPGSTRFESSRVGAGSPGPFPRVSRRPYRRSRASVAKLAHTPHRSSPGAPRFSFVRRASCRETGNNGGIRGEIKTAYGLFIFVRRRATTSGVFARGSLALNRP